MAHIHEKIDPTVEVFIVHENKVLLRIHDKYKIWLSIGGHIELDEDPVQAAIREVKEEVGMDIELYKEKPLYDSARRKRFSELIPPIYLNRHRINESHEHVTLVYFAKSNTNKIKQQDNEEVSEECKWFSLDEIQKNAQIPPSVRFYAEAALKALGK